MLEFLLGVGAGVGGVMLCHYGYKRYAMRYPERVKAQEEEKNDSHQPEPAPQPKPKQPSAKKALLDNVDRIVPLLVDLSEDNLDNVKWSEVIVDINNEALIAQYEKMVLQPKIWINWLASCGISCEKCSSFVCVEAYKQKYQLADGAELINGKEYKVLKPCWILTKEDASGNSKKKVLVKGIVELIAPKNEN